MNLEEFINTDPNFYGNGNANLFYSSSISGSDNVPVAPFVIQGLSIPNRDLAGNNLISPLKEVQKFKFDFGGARIEATITGRQKKNNYTFFSINPISVNALPPDDGFGSQIEDESEFIFNPYFDTGYFNSDFNPLQGNSSALLRNTTTMVVDRNASQIIPGNLDALIAGTAEKAEIVDSFNETVGLLSGRSAGSKTTSAPEQENIKSLVLDKQAFLTLANSKAVAGNEPAIGFKKFEGSVHTTDADNTTIKGLSEREKVNILFNSVRVNDGGNLSFPNFPRTGSVIYLEIEESNRLRKAASLKVFAVETNKVITTDEDGVVTTIA